MKVDWTRTWPAVPGRFFIWSEGYPCFGEVGVARITSVEASGRVHGYLLLTPLTQTVCPLPDNEYWTGVWWSRPGEYPDPPIAEECI